jgi:hypothetical protein
LNPPYQIRQTASGWRWRAYDASGKLCAAGDAASRAIAAAHIIRALTDTVLAPRDLRVG